MEFNEEIFNTENIPYFLSFGRDNDAIKSLIFNETFMFTGNEQHCINIVSQVLHTFNRETINSITFRNNYIVDTVLKQIIPLISYFE